MIVTILGNGGGLATSKQGHTAFLVSLDDRIHEGKKLLIDAGYHAVHYLVDMESISLKSIDAIYISHVHSDHIGGLEFIANCRLYFPKLDTDGNIIKPTLYVHRRVLDELLRAMKPLLGTFYNGQKYSDLYDYFEIIPVNAAFVFEDIEFRLIRNEHIKYSANVSDHKPCYGLEFTHNGRNVAITCDTSKPYDLSQYDLILHDVELGFRTGVHCHYDDLVEAFTKTGKWPQIGICHYGNRRADLIHPNFFYGEKGTVINI